MRNERGAGRDARLVLGAITIAGPVNCENTDVAGKRA